MYPLSFRNPGYATDREILTQCATRLAVVQSSLVTPPRFVFSTLFSKRTEGPATPGFAPAGNYATSAELESTKQELMTFVREEISKAKQEIIEGTASYR